MSYRFVLIDPAEQVWESAIKTHPNSTVFQSPAWIRFVSHTQNAEPVLARLMEGNQTIGYFTGLIVKKFGLKILGSPFPGWSTDYMGLAVCDGVCRRRAVQALIEFAFGSLGCAHVEIMDRNLSPADLQGLDVYYRMYHGFQIDLTKDEQQLFTGMSNACRRCIRKAEKSGVTVQETQDPQFAQEYFAQLCDVFAKQGLVPTYGIERVQQLINHVYPAGNLLLLRACDSQGRCIATGIFPHSNGVMYFWGGASWRHSQHLRPNEALQWSAMKIAREIGIQAYDMGGSGEYKRKYGGEEIHVPWIRKSKFNMIEHMRNLAQQAYRTKQWVSGQLRLKREPVL